jgi:hypothetical protein
MTPPPNFAFNIGHVKALWEACVINALNEAEREQFFTWMVVARFTPEPAVKQAPGVRPKYIYNARDTKERSFPTDLAALVFGSLFCNPAKFDPTRAGMWAYTAFEVYFRLANGQDFLLSNWEFGITQADGFSVRICDAVVFHVGNILSITNVLQVRSWNPTAELQGLNQLWQMALRANTPNSADGTAEAALSVSRDAMRFLIALHVQLAPAPEDLAASAYREGRHGAPKPGVTAGILDQETGQSHDLDSDEERLPDEATYERAAAELRRDVWEEFVQRCMSMITTAYEVVMQHQQQQQGQRKQSRRGSAGNQPLEQPQQPDVSSSAAGPGPGPGGVSRRGAALSTIAKAMRLLTSFLAAVEATAPPDPFAERVPEPVGNTIVLPLSGPPGPARLDTAALERDVDLTLRQLVSAKEAAAGAGGVGGGGGGGHADSGSDDGRGQGQQGSVRTHHLRLRVRLQCETFGDLRDRIAELLQLDDACKVRLTVLYIAMGTQRITPAPIAADKDGMPVSLPPAQHAMTLEAEELAQPDAGTQHHVSTDRKSRITRSLVQAARLRLGLQEDEAKAYISDYLQGILLSQVPDAKPSQQFRLTIDFRRMLFKLRVEP